MCECVFYIYKHAHTYILYSNISCIYNERKELVKMITFKVLIFFYIVVWKEGIF